MSKISISAAEKILKDSDASVAVNWHGNDLVIKRMLSFHDMLSFVGGVVDGCFDSETYEYIPEAREFILRASIVEVYTNLRLPENIDRKYAILYGTDIMRCIFDNIDMVQFDDMMTAINSKIKYRANSNAEMLLKKISQVEGKLGEAVASIGSAFSGITDEDVKNFFSAVSSGSFDEEKLVKLVLEQEEKKAEK